MSGCLDWQKLLFFLLLHLNPYFAYSAENTKSSSQYEKHPYVSQEIWDSCKPHFLPTDHPIKKALDKIFKKNKRVILNQNTLKHAGFKHTKPRKYSHTIVAKHKKLKGYLVKMYADEQYGVIDWAKWKDRIKGAETIRKCIEENAYQNNFKVPKKWIYPLPSEPSPPNHLERKNFILIVEDMNIVDKRKNIKLWKSNCLCFSRLDAVFVILKQAGLNDSVYVWNMPFSKDGKIAFIDTEYYHFWPVRYNKLLPFLSKKNQIYWSKLTLKE